MSAIELILQLQQIGGSFGAIFFRMVTFLGDQEFYLLMFPLLFWCIDTRLGIRVAAMYLISTWFNVTIKEITLAPRPFEVDPSVGIIDEEGFGMPSNHAQATTVIFGVLAHHLQKKWAWVTAAVFALLVGFSRIYLGVHFPLQVIIGWLLGGLFLALYIGYSDQVEGWVIGRTLPQHLGLATVIALIGSFAMPRPDIVATLATLWGLWCSVALLHALGVPFSAEGSLAQKIGRYILGSIVVVAIFGGLRAIFPDEGEAFYILFRFIRYGLIGLFVGFGGPWLFIKTKLA